MEFTGYPDLNPRDGPSADAADGAARAADARPPRHGRRERRLTTSVLRPTVDVTMRMQEGKQYFVNRITFIGNTTTRDNVIRREMRLVEGGVFNTEALKDSVRRLISSGTSSRSKARHRREARRRTPTTRSTSRSRSRSRTATSSRSAPACRSTTGSSASSRSRRRTSSGAARPSACRLQQGNRGEELPARRSREPFLFDRPITAGIDVFSREIQYSAQYTQESTGGNIVFGFPVRRLLAHVPQLQLRAASRSRT